MLINYNDLFLNHGPLSPGDKNAKTMKDDILSYELPFLCFVRRLNFYKSFSRHIHAQIYVYKSQ